MVSALDAVLTKQLLANKAAKLYGVPPSTLDRLSGHVVHGVKPGPTPYLTTKEEKELAEHLVLSAKVYVGYDNHSALASNDCSTLQLSSKS